MADAARPTWSAFLPAVFSLRLPSPRTWRMGGEAWLPWAKAPSASRGYSCAAPLVVAACCTPARVCISLSFVLAARCPIVGTRLSRRPSAALTALLKLLYQSLQLSSHLNQSPRAAPAVQAARPQPPVLSVRGGASRRPAGGIQRWPAAGAGRAGRPQARAAAGRVAARWHGVGGRGRWKRPFAFPIPQIVKWSMYTVR